MPETFSYNPLAPSVLDNPFPVYNEMRKTSPVAHFTGLPTPYYILFRYEDVREAAMQSDLYTVRFGVSPSFQDPGSLTNDGPAHLAFRQVLQGRFIPRRVSQYEAGLTEIADDLIDTMMANGRSAELHEDYAAHLPVRATALVLGVTDTADSELKRYADQILNSLWQWQNPEHAAAYWMEACHLFDRYIDARLETLTKAGIDAAKPEHVGRILPDDAISDVICGTVFGRPLTRPEMHQLLVTLLVGGNETTIFMITNCIWRLLEDRRRWEAVKADPDRLVPAAIEESLRFDPPGLGLWRTTACPVSRHGVAMPEHAKVQMSWASANRDPNVFHDPDVFSLDRDVSEVRRHLTFGAGAHLCLGQHLARMEMAVTLRAFIQRLPNLRLNGATDRVGNFGFWGRQKLPISW